MLQLKDSDLSEEIKKETSYSVYFLSDRFLKYKNIEWLQIRGWKIDKPCSANQKKAGNIRHSRL